MSFSKEVDLIAAARAVDLLTTPYVFDVEQARQMARAGALAWMRLLSSSLLARA